ncbi:MULTISPECIES: hypothetical protein [Klebsiella]|uniref:hypothetical protein n=1 Tax=Klebsiella TaxID=570 RepID=UPI000A84FB14|nr:MULTISPECIES: hypothetical protein [Klebsiella]MBZ7675403.1 hypothetical protein [Klebsiella grimontii]MDU2811670.1 hypothetical protein [Klebsiella michiganensis]MDU4793883.1 hypothetical protein [Klebsiella michiganensis]HDX9150098.1 hypothetical protein [Klebsiella michiganensis]
MNGIDLINVFHVAGLLAAICMCSWGKGESGDKTLKARNMLNNAVWAYVAMFILTFASVFLNSYMLWGLTTGYVEHLVYYFCMMFIAPASMYSWAVLFRWAGNSANKEKRYIKNSLFFVSFFLLNPIVVVLFSKLTGEVVQFIHQSAIIVIGFIVLRKTKGYNPALEFMK